jgi:serine/threonine-protein kinase
MDLDSHPGDRISLQERVDRLCDDFEAQWGNGPRPRIADFVDRLEFDDRPALFYELMLVDLEYRHKRGEHPSRQEYLRNYPQFSGKISALYFQFGDAAFGTVGHQKDETIARGTRSSRAPGISIGPFELRELLGTGSMGDVWKAWDPRLQRPVAVKIPRVEYLTESETLRFLREGRAAAQLRHPNLAAVYEVDRDGDTPYIASEFVDGDNLRSYCARSKLLATNATSDSINRRLTFCAIANLCAEIAEALHHAHEQGIVHRDLKPANIIIDRANRPYVIDFGLAKWATDDRDLTLHGELLGTPAYMSPEQALGQRFKIDRRTDIYSLGVILYELLSGQCPFTGELGSLIHQILSVDALPVRKLNVKVPRDLETICIKALEKNPDDRYDTMQALAVDLRRFVGGEPILARRTGPLEASWRWVRRRPSVAAAFLAMVLIVSASGAVIRSLSEKNHRLQGYRPVRIQTTPPGARVAIVRLNDATGEPNHGGRGVVRPDDATPCELLLKPGNYLIEAVLPENNQVVAFTEVYRTIPAAGRTAEHMRQKNREHGRDEDTFYFSVDIYAAAKATKKMLAVPIAESLRRKNSLLPKLLYVDATETKPKITPRVTKRYLSFSAAIYQAQQCGNRLPSAAEYEAIERAARNHEIVDPETGKPAEIEDLLDGVAEWTTTRYQLVAAGRTEFVSPVQDNRLLAGYGDPDQLPGLMRTDDNKLYASTKFYSVSIGFRGVRSGAPRFVKP